MGYDGAISGKVHMNNIDITGTEVINSTNIKRVTSNTWPIKPSYTEDNTVKFICPFDTNKAFTIAIDYQFGASNQTTLPEVLVGCYDKSQSGSITGFALYRGYSSS